MTTHNGTTYQEISHEGHAPAAPRTNRRFWPVLLAVPVFLAGTGAARGQQPRRTRVAEGEYEIYEQPDVAAGGPFGQAVYNFHESWTLYRLEKGGYQVQGRFESPSGQGSSNPFVVELSKDLAVVSMKEFASLKWVPDSGPLSCAFQPAELDCSAEGAEERKGVDLRNAFANPYALLWPMSPLSLREITRRIKVDPSHPIDVDLVTIEQPSAANPVQADAVHGPLQYMGEEPIEAAGQKWQAQKFSLKVGPHREYLIWTSEKGLLLALAVEHNHKNWRNEGMRLARLHSYSDF